MPLAALLFRHADAPFRLAPLRHYAEGRFQTFFA